MEWGTITEMIMTLGITPAYLLLFALYTFRRDKKRDDEMDKQMAARDNFWTKETQSSQEVFRKLVDTHLADGIRREELMRQESEKRENIIRQEAEKREAMLMRTIDGFGDSMKQLSDTMGEMNKTLIKIDFRLTNIEKDQQRRRDG